MNNPPYFEGAIRNIVDIVPGQKYTKHYTGPCKFTEDIQILSRPYWSEMGGGDFWVTIRYLNNATYEHNNNISLGNMGVIPYSFGWNLSNYLTHYVESKKKVKTYR